jgi:hypothetical protein
MTLIQRNQIAEDGKPELRYQYRHDAQVGVAYRQGEYIGTSL